MTAHHDANIARLLATLVLAVVTALSGCAQALSLDDGSTKAGRLFQQGDYDGVIALLQPMADRDPKLSTTSLDLLGMAYYTKHQYPQAAAALEKATAPGMFSGMPFGGRRINMRNNGVLGWCYFHMNDPARSMAAFNKALAKSDFQRDPAWDESALRGRAWVHYFQGDFQGADADLTQAQRLAETNPDINDAYDRHLAMAYVSLGMQRDHGAEAMAQAALAAAKNAGTPALLARRDVAPVYLMLGKRDQAYDLFGSKAVLGAAIQDDPDGVSQGVYVVKALPGSPAQQAGLMAGNVIVAVDGQAVATARELSRRIGGHETGQHVQLALRRNGSPLKLTVTLAGPDATIAGHHLLQPVLKVRQLPAAPISGTATVVVDMPPPAAEPSVPQVETPVPPELRIESVQVAPRTVTPGKRFELTINLFALDQDLRAETVPVVLRYAISKDGKELARFAPETFQVPNGVPSTIAKKTRTSANQAKGDYNITLEIEMGSLRARADATFTLH